MHREHDLQSYAAKCSPLCWWRACFSLQGPFLCPCPHWPSFGLSWLSAQMNKGTLNSGPGLLDAAHSPIPWCKWKTEQKFPLLTASPNNYSQPCKGGESRQHSVLNAGVLFIDCCKIKHPNTNWLKTIRLLSHVLSMDQELGKAELKGSDSGSLMKLQGWWPPGSSSSSSDHQIIFWRLDLSGAESLLPRWFVRLLVGGLSSLWCEILHWVAWMFSRHGSCCP